MPPPTTQRDLDPRLASPDAGPSPFRDRTFERGMAPTGPRFVRREGDVGYFEPAGGGEPRAVHLPSAPSFARIAEEADAAARALQARPGGVGARAPVADLGGVVPPRADEGADPALVEAFRQRHPGAGQQLPPDAFDLEAAQRRAAEIQAAPPPAQPAPAPQPTVGGPLAIPVEPIPDALRQLPTGPASRIGMHGTSPQTGPADVADLTGGARLAPGAPGAPVARAPGGPRFARPAPAAPPTEAQLNDQLISELTTRPTGDRPLVPGDMRTSSFADRTGDLISEGERIASDRAHQAGVRAAEEQDVLEATQARRDALERDRQDAMRGAQQRYRAAVQRMEESRIDPNRFFADRGGAAGRIGAAIATALGAAGSVLTGGPNQALAIIQEEIGRDIEAQRANQMQAREGVGAARTFLDVTRQEFSDREAAEEAAQALAWNAVARRAAMHEAEIGEAEARTRAQGLRLQAEEQAAAHSANAARAQMLAELDLRQRAANVARTEAQALRERRRATGGGGAGGGLRQRAATARALQQVGVDDQQAREAAGLGGFGAAPPEGPQVTADLAQRVSAVVNAQRELEAILPTGEGEDIPGVGRIDSLRPGILQSSAGRVLQSRAANLIRRFMRLESGAVIGDAELQDELDARGMGSGSSEEQWQEGYRQLRSDIQARLDALRGSMPNTRNRRGELDAASEAAGFAPDEGG